MSRHANDRFRRERALPLAGHDVRTAFYSSPSNRWPRPGAEDAESKPDKLPMWILVTGIPTTAVPSDVIRLVNQRADIEDSSRERAGEVHTMITEARPVYMSASMTPSNMYVFKTIDPKYDSTVVNFLNRRSIAGETLRARMISVTDAENMSKFRIADLDTSTPTGSQASPTPVKRFSLRTGGNAHSGWLPDSKNQYETFIKAIISKSPGRVVLLRGLPPNITPDALKRRLDRAYKLAIPSESRLPWYNTRKREWQQVEVEPVLRITTYSNRHLWKDSVEAGAGSASIFLVRLQNALHAQRLYRSFHRQCWNSLSRSYIYSSFTRKLIQRRLERSRDRLEDVKAFGMDTDRWRDDRWRDEEGDVETHNAHADVQASDMAVSTQVGPGNSAQEQHADKPDPDFNQARLLKEADDVAAVEERLAHQKYNRRDAGRAAKDPHPSQPKAGEVRSEHAKHIMEVQIMY